MQLAFTAIFGFFLLVYLLTGMGKKKNSAARHRGRAHKRSGGVRGVRGEVASALRNQGYSALQARRLAENARGVTFDQLFSDALRKGK